MRTRRLGHLFGWLALAVLLLALLTGFGITRYQVVDTLTLGLLSKAASLRWHEQVGVLVALLLVPHVAISLWARLRGSPAPGGPASDGPASGGPA
jgi:cytochrome b561